MSESFSVSTVPAPNGPVLVRHAGVGPLIILCHGFPETSAGWQHLIAPLASAGYTVAAVDLRGMGGSDWTAREIGAIGAVAAIDDLIAVADHLGHRTFHLVGGDLGAMVAWTAALLRPDLVRSVTGLALPFFAPTEMAPLQLLGFLSTASETPYLLRFTEDDANDEMEADPHSWVTGCMASISGRVPASQRVSGMVPISGRVADNFVTDAPLDFIADDQLESIVTAYQDSGFAGAMAWYQSFDRDWEQLRSHAGKQILPPAQFVGGDVDPVNLISDGAVAELSLTCADLQSVDRLEGVGHWPHLEAPHTVVDRILALVSSVDVSTR